MRYNRFAMFTSTAQWSSIGLLGIGGLIIAYALLFDCLRQRVCRLRRCPKCWYDMSHAPGRGLRCSECGHTARRERQLYKSQRKWRIAVLGVAMLLASHAVRISGDVRSRGWTAAVPTTAMIALLPWTYSDGFVSTYQANPKDHDWRNALYIELKNHRIGSKSLWTWQERLLVWRCLRGDRRHEPPSASWDDSYGRLLRALVGVYPLQKSWLRDALALFDFRISSRDTWPTDTPVHVHILFNSWFEWDGTFYVELEPRVDGLKRVTFVHDRTTRAREWTTLTRDTPSWAGSAGIPDAQSTVLAWTVTIQCKPDRPLDTELFHVATFIWEVPIRIEGEPAAHLRSTDSPEIRDALMKHFQPGMTLWAAHRHDESVDGAVQDWVYLIDYEATEDYDWAFLEAIKDVTFGLDIEILRNGTPVRRGSTWFSYTSDPEWEDRWRYLGESDFTVKPILPSSAPEDDTWVVRIRGAPEIALQNFDADVYWSGELTLPLSVHIID